MAKKTKQIQDLTDIYPQRPQSQSAGEPRAGGLWPHHPGRDREAVRGAGQRVTAFPSSSASPTTKASWSTGCRRRAPAASGVILNAAGYTHTSVAMLDACQMLNMPVIEVHLSNPTAASTIRRHSYVAKGATGIITGWARNGYLLAIDASTPSAEILKDEEMNSKNDTKAGMAEASRASTPTRCANWPSC